LLFFAADRATVLWEYHDNFLRHGQIELTMKWLPRAVYVNRAACRAHKKTPRLG